MKLLIRHNAIVHPYLSRNATRTLLLQLTWKLMHRTLDRALEQESEKITSDKKDKTAPSLQRTKFFDCS